MAESTIFEEVLREHPLTRDLILISFLVLGFGLPFKFLFEMALPGLRISFSHAIGSGLLFAFLWLTAMEVWMRRKNSSIFRYFLGPDPLEE